MACLFGGSGVFSPSPSPRRCPCTAGCSPPSMSVIDVVLAYYQRVARRVVDGFFIRGVLPVVY